MEKKRSSVETKGKNKQVIKTSSSTHYSSLTTKSSSFWGLDEGLLVFSPGPFTLSSAFTIKAFNKQAHNVKEDVLYIYIYGKSCKTAAAAVALISILPFVLLWLAC